MNTNSGQIKNNDNTIGYVFLKNKILDYIDSIKTHSSQLCTSN